MKLILFVMLYVFSLQALAIDLGKHGQTFPIKEENLLEYIKRRLASMMHTGEITAYSGKLRSLAEQQILRPKSLGISHTITPREYLYDPTYTLDEDIKNLKGDVIHKKGTKINPLDKVSLDGNMLFINGDDARQIAWAISLMKHCTDKDHKAEFQQKTPSIILVQGSPIKLEETHGFRFYFDQLGSITTKLGIKQVPAVVSQEDKLLKISEVNFE